MLNTSSVLLEGSETFAEAFAKMPDGKGLTQIRYLSTEDGKKTGVYQLSQNGGQTWGSPRILKPNKDGQIIPLTLDSKAKLSQAGLFYDLYTKPTHVGTDKTQSWIVGDIDGCKILNDEYNIQGMIISTIFDPTPKYYISFERIVCENQFSSLGRNSASMYIDMNAFLQQAWTMEDKDKLSSLITAEVNKRIDESERVYNKLAMTHLSEDQIRQMFEKLTIDTVAKKNEEAYAEQEKRLNAYLTAYNCDDNQNFRGSLFGFVNAATNIKTREKTNPLDVLRPVLPAQVIDSPCNFEYLCRAALVNA